MTQKYSGAQNFVNYTQINENLKGGAYYSPSYVFNDYNTGYNLEGGAGSKKKKPKIKTEEQKGAANEAQKKYVAKNPEARAETQKKFREGQKEPQPQKIPQMSKSQSSGLPSQSSGLPKISPKKVILAPKTEIERDLEEVARSKVEAKQIQDKIDRLVNKSNDLLQKYQSFITDFDAYDKDNRATPKALQKKIDKLKDMGAKIEAENIEKGYNKVSNRITEVEEERGKMPEQITSPRQGQASSLDGQKEQQENVETALPKALNIGQADAIQGATEQFNRGGIDPNVGNPDKKATKLEGNKPLENLEEKYGERKQEFEFLNNEEDSNQLMDEAVIDNPQTPSEFDPNDDYSNDSFISFTEQEAYEELINRIMREQGLSYNKAIEVAEKESQRNRIPSMPTTPFYESIRTALERKREGIKSGIESGLPSQILPQRQGQGQATPSIEEQKQGLEGQGDNMLGHSDLQKLTDKVETGFNLLVDTIINKNDRNKLFSKDTEKQITEVLKGAAKLLIKDPNGLLLPTDKQLKFGVDNVLSSLKLPIGTEASMKQSLTDVVKMTTGYMGEPVPLFKVKERIRLQADPALIKKRVSSYFGDRYILQRAPTRIVQPTEYLNYLRVGGVRYA